MQSNIFLFSGPGIFFDRIQEEELNRFIRVGNGKDFIKEEDIDEFKGKSKVAIIFGHGKLDNCRGLENTNVVARINLISNQIFTACNIVFLQKKLGIQHFYLFSCFSGVVPYHLVKLKDMLNDKTTVTIFTDDKPIISGLCEEIIKKIQLFYQEHQSEEMVEIDRKFYLENVLFAAWTSVRCEITNHGGRKKFSAFKVKGPRHREDILDEKYIHKKHRLKAIVNEDETVFKKWLAQVTQNNIKIDSNEYRNSAFLDSVQRGKLERVKDWIEEGININAMTSLNLSGLHIASFFGYFEIAQFLIENKADVHRRTDLGYTPLLLAAQKGQYEIVKILIDAGANVNHQADNNVTALYLAEKNGHLEVVKILIDKGAKINFLTSIQGFYEAIEKGYREIVEIMLNAGIIINFIMPNGFSPLYMASSKGYVDIAKLLIRNRAKVDGFTTKKMTPLMVACSEGHIQMVATLLEAKANVHAKDLMGITALGHATQKGHLEILKLLIKNGAKIDVKALDYAKKRGREEIVQLLEEPISKRRKTTE